MDIYLRDFKKENDRETFSCAMNFMREHPGCTLHVGGGEYILTSDRARQAQDSVMRGEWGTNPQKVMFSPDYVYDCGIDLDGMENSVILGEGAKIIVDGFMETVSVKNCKNIKINGFTFDVARRPFSRGKVRNVSEKEIEIDFGKEYPITHGMPYMRACFYDRKNGRLNYSLYLSDMIYENEYSATFKLLVPSSCIFADEVYIWHTFHSRPAILIEDCENITVENVTVYSHPGMGITALHAKNVTLDSFCVIPAPGEHMSTNTDATHFASCRGRLILKNCRFQGQGDDSINCHTYYYDILEANGNRVKMLIKAPDGIHTQSVDFPFAGDVLELTERSTLDIVDRFKCISAKVDYENGVCDITLDRKIDVENVCDKYYFADADSLPELLLSGCTMKDHMARGALIKAKYAVVENCTFENISGHGIKIAPEASWKEGCATNKVSIRNSRFINCSHLEKTCSAVNVYSEADDRNALPHGIVEMTDCYIECEGDQTACSFFGVKNVVFKNNIIKNPFSESVVFGPGVKYVYE